MESAGALHPLPEPRRLVTPARAALLENFRAHEQRSMVWLGLEIAAILGGLAWWATRPERLPDWQSALLFTAAFLGMFDFVLSQIFANRKPLEDVRPDAKLGIHTRDSLLASKGFVRRKSRPAPAASR